MSATDRTQPPPAAAVRPFRFPDVGRLHLDNGLSLFRAPHGHVPIATARIVLDAGVTREPPELAGVAHLVAHTIDTGTRIKDARQLSWELESMGAQLEVATGFDATSVSVTVPAERLPAALTLLAEIVVDACFPEDEVERARNEQLGEIAQRRSDPRSLASDEAMRFIYGPDATYGRTPLGSADAVERLTVGDVRAFYHDRYSPRSAALLLVGQLQDTVAQRFTDWHLEPAPARGVTLPAADAVQAVHIVHRPGSVQSEIRIGHAGPTRADPDYFPLQVMNSILGGAFTSRLNMNLREKHGFTYGVRSSFSFRRGHGPFMIATAVASDVTARAIGEILAEIEALRVTGPTDEEIVNTRDYLTGLMPLELQTTHQLAGKLSELFIHTLPDDYFRTYRDRIAAVSREDALRAAQQHIRPAGLTFLVVGDADQIEAPLRDLSIAPIEVHAADE
ncbi:MAG: M16 family metallopeptidase [Longimicrobiales bacterium]